MIYYFFFKKNGFLVFWFEIKCTWVDVGDTYSKFLSWVCWWAVKTLGENLPSWICTTIWIWSSKVVPTLGVERDFMRVTDLIDEWLGVRILIEFWISKSKFEMRAFGTLRMIYRRWSTLSGAWGAWAVTMSTQLMIPAQIFIASRNAIYIQQSQNIYFRATGVYRKGMRFADQ